LLNESYANGGQTIPYPNVSGLGKGTNWQDKVLMQVFQLSIMICRFLVGLTKLLTVSGSHLDQEGIIGGNKSGFKEYGTSIFRS
jgi:hypothetical protein